MELKVTAGKSYGSFSLELDFSITGDRLGLYGPSGSGKSTLMHLIAGLVQPDHGFIGLDGETLFDGRKKLNVPPERRRISIVFQQPHLFPHLNVRGNLLYGYRRCAPIHRKICLEDLTEVLQISHLLDRGVKNLSGGEKQRVAIARAVLSNPRMLLMDEPLSALDDSLKFQIIPFLKRACEAFTIPYLFISHSLLEMRIMTEQVLNLSGGRSAGWTTAEGLARRRGGESGVGYINLLRLSNPRRVDGIYGFPWGGCELFVSADNPGPEQFFELPSSDIILFRHYPEAISARNLLNCTVTDVFEAGTRVCVELRCGNERLIAQMVGKAAEELEIKKGSAIYAAVKATAFRQLC